MCTRYWTEESPELRPIVEEMRRSPLVRKWQNITAVKDYGEIRPTVVVPVIAPNRSGSRAVYPMKWGYSGKSLLVNEWIRPDRKPEELLPYALTEMMFEKAV